MYFHMFQILLLMKVKVCILYMLYRHFLLLQIPTCIYTTMQVINIDVEKLICNWQYTISDDHVLYQLKLTFCLLLLSRENSDGLSCIENQPMTELCYVDIGLGYQSVRLEFDTMCSSYSFLIREEERCKSFISLITGSCFGYTVYNIVSRFMSYRHMKVHVKECFFFLNDFIGCKIWRTVYKYVRCNWVGIQLNFTCVI